MNPVLRCFYRSGPERTFTECIRFTLVRDRYQPFAVLHVQMHTDSHADVPVRVQFSLGGRLLHDGVVVKCDCALEQGQHILRLTARSYTSLLVQNQLVPGIHTDVTLASLLETYALPHITYQPDVEMIRYIYVKDNASMWDTVTAYNFKLNSGFPYIRVPNLLCVLPQTGTVPAAIPEQSILKLSDGGELSGMLSRIDMANMVGEYGTYTRSNPLAPLYGIVRVKQILLDRQYVYEPDDALRFRIALGNRRLRSKTVSYAGYCGEDAEDLVSVGSRFTARVSRIVLTGDQGGLTTSDTFYFDDFCNVQ
ncbi:MAG: hypothetical protein IKQ39_02910 [Oscillospiraceae bacterium]|nr:hypothetical protein [Oscillospiraceae bacterium]